jgi:TetR/AcrR family transcriptional repressor of nem operon
MPRPREFDPREAVSSAMQVFWQKGYPNTSIGDLVSATGVNRHGLYQEFGSKRGLFLACLDHYQNVVVSGAFGVVEQEGASFGHIEAYFATLQRLAATGKGDLGCLMSNSAAEVAPYDRQAARKVEGWRTRLRTGFEAALRNARSAGLVSARLNTWQAADFLVGVTQGVSVMARSKADPKMIANVIATAIAGLRRSARRPAL